MFYFETIYSKEENEKLDFLFSFYVNFYFSFKSQTRTKNDKIERNFKKKKQLIDLKQKQNINYSKKKTISNSHVECEKVIIFFVVVIIIFDMCVCL